jgi:hypothetical protein
MPPAYPGKLHARCYHTAPHFHTQPFAEHTAAERLWPDVPRLYLKMHCLVGSAEQNRGGAPGQ